MITRHIRRRIRGRMCCIIAAALLSGLINPLTTAAPPQPAPNAPPKTVPISIAITQLRNEAVQSWHHDRQWPRTQADFAAAKNWAVPNDALVQAMTRSLDSNPAIDAYIKWQLTSFGVDISKADAATINRIVAHAPKPLEQPRPKSQTNGPAGGMSTMMFSGPVTHYIRDLDPVVGDGVVAYKPRVASTATGASIDSPDDSDMRQNVQDINTALAEAKKTVNAANQPVHAYRDLLLQDLPTTGGMRLAVMIKDARDRLEAGDPTFPDAMERIAKAMPKFAHDPSLNAHVRQTLIGWTRVLGKMSTPVVRSVELETGGRVKVHDKMLQADPKDIDYIIRQLHEGEADG